MNSKKDLDNLVIGTLPKHITDALAKMDIEISDVQEWAESQPTFRITVRNGYIDVFAKWHFHIGKTIGVISGIGTLTFFVINYWDEIAFIFRTIASQ